MPKYGKRFKKIVDEARKHPDYWAEEIRLDFMSLLADEMEKQKISQAELSRRLKKSPAYISKVFNADVGNFTIETLARFAMALNMKINIGIEPISQTVPEWDGDSILGTLQEPKKLGIYTNVHIPPKEETITHTEDLDKAGQEDVHEECSTQNYAFAA